MLLSEGDVYGRHNNEDVFLRNNCRALCRPHNIEVYEKYSYTTNTLCGAAVMLGMRVVLVSHSRSRSLFLSASLFLSVYVHVLADRHSMLCTQHDHSQSPWRFFFPIIVHSDIHSTCSLVCTVGMIRYQFKVTTGQKNKSDLFKKGHLKIETWRFSCLPLFGRSNSRMNTKSKNPSSLLITSEVTSRTLDHPMIKPILRRWKSTTNLFSVVVLVCCLGSSHATTPRFSFFGRKSNSTNVVLPAAAAAIPSSESSWSNFLTIDPSNILKIMIQRGGLILPKSIQEELLAVAKVCHVDQVQWNAVQKRLMMTNFTVTAPGMQTPSLRVGRLFVSWESYTKPCLNIEVDDVDVLLEFTNLLLTKNNWYVNEIMCLWCFCTLRISCLTLLSQEWTLSSWLSSAHDGSRIRGRDFRLLLCSDW